MPHTHNQPIQHSCDGKSPHTTTKQQPKTNPNQKTNQANNQKKVAQQTPTTTQIRKKAAVKRWRVILFRNVLMQIALKLFVRIVMPTAFVLINTEIGSESDVLKELKKVEGVEEASAVYGVYDIVARVKADTMDKLKEIVTWRIRRLDKVRSTLTMIVVEDK
jgi:DNA-binding Lrp family transcriptional regulator